jgi:hypothetical protein
MMRIMPSNPLSRPSVQQKSARAQEPQQSIDIKTGMTLITLVDNW